MRPRRWRCSCWTGGKCVSVGQVGVKSEPTNREWNGTSGEPGFITGMNRPGALPGGHGVLAQKLVVGWQGEPVEFGRRLHWEAMSAGLRRARSKLIVADGAPWIWNLAQDRRAGASEVLDSYHASLHLWELGRALTGNDETKLAQWVELRRHQLRHGNQGVVLSEIASLAVPSTEVGKVIKRQ